MVFHPHINKCEKIDQFVPGLAEMSIAEKFRSDHPTLLNIAPLLVNSKTITCSLGNFLHSRSPENSLYPGEQQKFLELI